MGQLFEQILNDSEAMHAGAKDDLQHACATTRFRSTHCCRHGGHAHERINYRQYATG
jgi:hypothetical protein